ncbi:TetR family transcriptional regulator [Saccharopolyspora sp. TS4A08]|uniref:TetR family transcriptional regulator n=1 Tax=Saccharopolyspora ipomoeae TaxID=3042027 RepID=A0ABT6PQQ8_9PSEU|nr:TetR family transcriptional regulator [Saccharopolyspora sp. TS4A08]MDI2030348.1 TetR family transcriptional regulator [Saccharopolyspora sp. TS4A08]
MPRPDDSAKPTRWAGVPAADRVSARRALLLDAALELLGTEGWSGTSVRAICQSARLNPRYFYESFTDLDDLVIALYDQLIDELREQVTDAVEAAGEHDRMRALVRATVEFIDADHRRGRVLYVEALGNEKLNRRRVETGFIIAGHVDAAGGSGDPLSMITASILVGGFSELLLAWLNGLITVTREQLIDTATALFTAMTDEAGTLPRC